MKRLRMLSIARPEALDRRNVKAAWGQAYWRGVNVRKIRERQLRQALQFLARLPRVEFVPVAPADGESAVEAARMVH